MEEDTEVCHSLDYLPLGPGSSGHRARRLGRGRKPRPLLARRCQHVHGLPAWPPRSVTRDIVAVFAGVSGDLARGGSIAPCHVGAPGRWHAKLAVTKLEADG
jgi:hypothetical protein